MLTKLFEVSKFKKALSLAISHEISISKKKLGNDLNLRFDIISKLFLK
jgi:hypothetical protein